MLTPWKSFKLPVHFEIEPELREQLSNRPGHQRCLDGRDELLLVLHEVPLAGVPEREACFFWRRRDGRWAQSGGSGLSELGELLDRYAEVIDSQEERLAGKTGVADICEVLRQAAPLARATHNLVVALEQSMGADVENREIRASRDRARELDRAAELLNTDARVILDGWQAEHAGEQSGVVRRLEAVALRMNLLGGFCLALLGISWLCGMHGTTPALLGPLVCGIVLGAGATGSVLPWLASRKIRGVR